MAFTAHRSVTEVDAQQWDDMSSGLLFESHGWLAANESTLIGEPIITVESEGGELRSAVVWQATEVAEPSPYYNIAALLARFCTEELPECTGWALNCTGVGPHSPMLVAPGLTFDRSRLGSHIATAVATRSTPPAICGVNSLPREPAPGAATALGQLGFGEVEAYRRAFLQLPGSSFDDYLMGLGSSKKRWYIRRDRKNFADTGQTISFTSGTAAIGEDIVALQGLNKQKYGQSYDPDDVRLRFSELLSYTDDDGLVARSFRGDVCTGFAMFFRLGDSLHPLCAGFEETEDRVSPYFECLFYAPIEWAFEHHIKEIDYGIGSPQAKSARGCGIVDVPTWYRDGTPS